MPRSRKPGGSSGRCPRCGGDLMSILVLHGGRHVHCPSCGFARVIEPVPPDPPVLARDEAEPSGRQEAVHLLFYAQAVLQTVRQARGCRRCQEHLAMLRTQADDLEQTRVDYARHPEQCDDARLDAFFDELTARLQGLGQLCRACRRRMEGTTWELFVGLLLAAREDGEL
jgi:DNA-directed RNA polymerase subunit RPC12/RpoP